MDGILSANLIWTILALAALAINVLALIYIPRDRKPTAAMAWLLLIFLLPFVGMALYLLIGNFRLPKRRRDEQARITAMIAERAGDHAQVDASRWLQRVAQQNHALTGLPVVGDSSARLIDDYQGSIDAMAAAIDTAERYVHVEFYIVAWDATTQRFFAAMEAAVRRGVTVRLLADYIASRKIPKSEETFAELDRIGVLWSWMLPVRPFKREYQRPDLRNHRKLVVVDGAVGFVGSQNLISRDYDSEKNIARGLMWQELVSRVDGAVVAQVDAVFLSDWLTETGEDLSESERVPASAVPIPLDADLHCQMVPSGPAYGTEINLRMFLSLIHGATERVILTSPYFVPDEAMIYAITTACQRGLDVQLFVSELGDQGMVYHAQRSYYETLLRAGVRIFLYPAPYILHAKHFSIDDDVAVIGSSNMDIRSFSLNAEMSLLVHGRSFVAQMREVEQKYRSVGRELTLEEWLREPAKSTFLDGLFRLTSALN
ncbi:cardiolipin synthase [Microbacterium sp. SA39]|uniref:cardiolipin synthase n=1 Tax=Microbacterium sp. SA39 TaxID=1263625 RepID=UPI0005FA4837|nr:cardiolipin synthase [Microbacterium sp. SA39]KJQ52445.1 Cardiolipin synthase [Microbacterium sp. SA39]